MTGMTGKKKWTMMYKYLSLVLTLFISTSILGQFKPTKDTFSRVYNRINTKMYDEVYLQYMSKETTQYLGEFIFNVSFPISDGLDSLYGVVLFDLDKGPVYFFSYADEPYEGSDITLHDYSSYPVYIFEALDDRWDYFDSGILTYYTRGPESYLELQMGPIILQYLP